MKHGWWIRFRITRHRRENQKRHFCKRCVTERNWSRRVQTFAQRHSLAFGMQKSGSENRTKAWARGDRQTERERERNKKNIEEQRGLAANWNYAAATTSFRAARRFRAKIQWLNRVIIPKTINDDVATPPFCSRPTNRRQLSSVLFGTGN